MARRSGGSRFLTFTWVQVIARGVVVSSRARSPEMVISSPVGAIRRIETLASSNTRVTGVLFGPAFVVHWPWSFLRSLSGALSAAGDEDGEAAVATTATIRAAKNRLIG